MAVDIACFAVTMPQIIRKIRLEQAMQTPRSLLTFWQRHGAFTAFAAALCLLVSGCSSSDEELIDADNASVVTDPVSFVVTGVDGELADNILNTIHSKPDISRKRVFLFYREIREDTQRALHAYGYYQPRINIKLPPPDNMADRTVHIEVDAGKPLFIRYCNVQILGEGLKYQVFHDLVKNSGLESYTPLNHGHYEELKNKLHDTALSLGFFDARLVSSRILVHQSQNMADVDLIFDTGRRYKFGPIIADDTTRELLKPAHGLMIVDEGREYSSEVLNRYVSSLNQTGFYSSVDVAPRIRDAKDYEVPLEINLERKSNNLMRLGAGYSTDEGPRALIEWDKPLLNESGHSLSAKADLSMIAQDAQIVYKIPRKDPNLDYYYINAAQTHTDFNDTLSDRSHLSFHYVANRTGVWRRDYSLRAEYEDYTQGADKGFSYNLMPALMLSRRESSGGFDPKRGYSLNLELTGASDVFSDLSFVRMLGTFRGVISPTDNTRLVMRLQQGAITGPDANNVPPSMRFFAGGDQSIRGYGFMNESVMNSGGLNGATYLTTGSLEFQFPMGIANSRLAVFMDGGMAVDNYRNFSEDLLLGPGLGYRFVSPYGTVRVDVGFGIDKDPTSVRLHVAFGPEF